MALSKPLEQTSVLLRASLYLCVGVGPRIELHSPNVGELRSHKVVCYLLHEFSISDSSSTEQTE